MDNSLQHLNNGFNEKNTTCKRIHQQTEEIFFLIRYNGSMPLNGHLYMNIECTQFKHTVIQVLFTNINI